MRQSPAWCVHLIYCNQISLNHVAVHTKFDENGNRYKDIVNGDGFDPDSCSDVYVFNSLFASQDDCIAVKSGRDKEGRDVGIPSERIRVSNCTFTSGFGVVMGSEMSGGVRDVVVQDCVFQNVHSIASIKAPRGRGAVIEDIVYKRCTLTNLSTELTDCKWFRGALLVDQFYSHEDFDVVHPEEVTDGTPVFQNITFQDITIETVAGHAIYIVGLPESPIRNLRLHNVVAKGKYSTKISNVQGLEMTNVTVEVI